jgi:hypothetical protein
MTFPKCPACERPLVPSGGRDVCPTTTCPNYNKDPRK